MKQNRQSTPSKRIDATCEEHHLLFRRDGVMRVPLLVRGELRLPPVVTSDDLPAHFAALDQKSGLGGPESGWSVVGEAQVLRFRLPEGDDFIVLPRFDPSACIDDPAKIASDLADLPFAEVERFCQLVAASLAESSTFVACVRDETRRLSEVPSYWHDWFFDHVTSLFDGKILRAVADQELGRQGVAGTRFLEEWVGLETTVSEDAAHALLRRRLAPKMLPFAADRAETVQQLRAMPTRQLHITAGNAPEVPVMSLLRALATKSAAVVKAPRGATPTLGLIALAAGLAAPDHPLTRHLSLLYWKGGDAQIENQFYHPAAFDRVVVWGDPSSVMAVKSKALWSKVIAFNPRYSLSFIGKEALALGPEMLREVAVRAAADVLIANQKACIASQVHYVEGTKADAERYAAELAAVLRTVDQEAPNLYPQAVIGALKRLERGRFADATWLVNKDEGGRFQSGTVVVEDEFPIKSHPMCRLVIVRPVARLEQALEYLNPSVATVGIYPSARRVALRNQVATRGVSNIVELGKAGLAWAGQAHDGMVVLSELVDWKNG